MSCFLTQLSDHKCTSTLIEQPAIGSLSDNVKSSCFVRPGNTIKIPINKHADAFSFFTLKIIWKSEMVCLFTSMFLDEILIMVGTNLLCKIPSEYIFSKLEKDGISRLQFCKNDTSLLPIDLTDFDLIVPLFALYDTDIWIQTKLKSCSTVWNNLSKFEKKMFGSFDNFIFKSKIKDFVAQVDYINLPYIKGLDAANTYDKYKDIITYSKNKPMSEYEWPAICGRIISVKHYKSAYEAIDILANIDSKNVQSIEVFDVDGCHILTIDDVFSGKLNKMYNPQIFVLFKKGYQVEKGKCDIIKNIDQMYYSNWQSTKFFKVL